MKTILALVALSLTACTSLDHFVCYGAGTCGADPNYSGPPAPYHSGLPQTVITNSGTYLIGRSPSSGAINSVIPVSRGK